jgi:hypothetical protein
MQPVQQSPIEKAVLLKNGFQFIAEAMLPNFMNNFIGRWLVWKMIAFLVDKKLVKQETMTELKKPLALSRYRTQFVGASTDALGELKQLVQQALFASFDNLPPELLASASSGVITYTAKDWPKTDQFLEDSYKGLVALGCSKLTPRIFLEAIVGGISKNEQDITAASELLCPYLSDV